MPPEPYDPASIPGGEADPDAAAARPAPGPAGEQAGPAGRTDGRPPGAFRRGRLRFRSWRRSRPFWGGLLLILAGLELLAIPLLSLLVHTAIKIVIYIGIGGVFGLVFGGLLIACGLLAWFHPVQRVFYGIVGVLLALGSFIVTNLGGFFLGMLLGVIGASLVFGWVPARHSGSGRRRHRRARREPDEGLDGVLGDRPASSRPSRGRLLALPVAPILMLGLAGTGQAPAAAAQGSCLIPLLSLLCPSSSPSAPAGAVAASASATPSAPAALPSATPSASAASPTASPSASATPGGAATPSPSVSPDPAVSPSGTASAAPSPSRRANPNANKKAPATASLVASDQQATLTAGSALMQGLSYDGVASMPTANGAQQMLKFSMTSLRLAGGIQLTTTGANTMVTRNTSATFTGNVVLYATKLCGDLLGIRLCFTPQSPPPLVLPIMTFTNVQTEQPLTTADSLAAPGLDITG